jgi:predicted aldo/keto reductase-like oxidoreductase
MQYRVLGSTGLRVSALGFGTMRFQMKDGHVDQELAISALHRAMGLGVNYFDSAVGYCNAESEKTLGKALKGRREGIVVSTKYPPWGERTKKADDCRMILEQSLSRLDIDCIDVYHMHGMGWDTFLEENAPDGALQAARKAKEEGLVKHLAFSFHDKPERMIEIFKEAPDLEAVTCQYNLLDRANEDSIAWAHAHDKGVVIMGPVAGGRLSATTEQTLKLLPGKMNSTPELAIRFVLTNPNVTVALSGMNTLAMVEENAATASRTDALGAVELKQIAAAVEENKKLADLYCTGCEYCLPCPNGVNIPKNFQLMNLHRVWGQTEAAQRHYNDGWTLHTEGSENLQACACVECGQCEPKCPQKIPIIEQLKETHRALGKQG